MNRTLLTKSWESDPHELEEVVGALDREILARGFRSNESLECSLESLCCGIGAQLGALVTFRGDEIVFDFTLPVLGVGA